jgi:polyisoprenoid-binding protein YceI
VTTIIKLSELTGDYVLDPAHTRIGFVARHTMATRVSGQFDEFEGGAHLDGDEPSRSSLRLTIQAKSIQTRNRQRDEQLRSSFLDVAKHPSITFTSTGIEQIDRTNFRVAGDLSIRGVTKPATVDFELTNAESDPWDNVRLGFVGRATINRKDWGVNWNAATGILVGAKVILEFDVTAIRQS